jgi:hypothetical protein
MPIREILKHVRPNTNIPFYPPESMFYFDTDISSSNLHAYFVSTYKDSGILNIGNVPTISEDGFTITYEIICPSEEVLQTVLDDNILRSNWEINNAYFHQNNILEISDRIVEE